MSLRSPDSLRPSQRLISQTIKEKDAVLIVAPMGSGKTAGTLDAVRHLLDRGEVGHVLVIAPRFVAQSTWPDEIETWAHTKPISYAVAVGDPVQRRQAIERRAEITTINFENLSWLAKFIESVDNWFWDMVVIDESSRFKAGEGYTKDTRVKTVSENGDIVVKVRKGGKQTRFGIMATARRKIDRIVELTGTPTPQGLTDLWGQVFLLDRGRRLGAAKSTFLKRHFNIDRDRHLITPRANAERDILGAIKDVVITIKGESQVPEPQFIPLRVELPPKIMKEYKAFEDTLYSEPYDVRAVSAGVLANKLLQYSSGFLYREDKSFAEVHDAKIDALEELVAQASGENLLIFYGFKPDLAKLKSKYPDAVVANEYKGNLVRDWNAGKIKKLLAHPASIGHGTNLQYGGHIAVWYTLTWSLELWQQANMRLPRPGQTKQVLIYPIIARGTYDERALSVLSRKEVTQDRIIRSFLDRT